MQIHVKETQSPGPGRKVGWVIDSDDRRFECWPDKLAGIHAGHTYEIQTKKREWQDRVITTITSYKRVEDLVQRMASAQRSPTRRSQPIDNGPPDDGVPPYGEPPGQFGGRTEAERSAFIERLLVAWANAGQLGMDESDVGRAIRAAERAWARIHGSD